jgi:hypothetical protein
MTVRDRGADIAAQYVVGSIWLTSRIGRCHLAVISNSTAASADGARGLGWAIDEGQRTVFHASFSLQFFSLQLCIPKHRETQYSIL